MSIHFSSKTDDWATPQKLFDQLDQEFGFDLDAAASSHNHKCDRWFGLDHQDESRRDGLMADWDGSTVWPNPPYGRTIGQWVAKAHKESHDKRVVLLLPARTDTAWFHDYCASFNPQFIRGRLKFGSAVNSAPFPSMIVVM